MANPITPNGRSRQNNLNPDILDIDNDHHTMDGDWVEDRPTNLGGPSLESFGRSQLNHIDNVNENIPDDLRGLSSVNLGESGVNRNDIGDNPTMQRQRAVGVRAVGVRAVGARDNPTMQRQRAVEDECRKKEAEKKVKEEEFEELKKQSKENFKNAIYGLRLSED